MAPLELLIYEATRIIEKGSPGLYQITSEHTFHRFEPIPNEDHRWEEGFFRGWVRGGTEPSYRVRIPEGELFEKEVGPGVVRTFLRIPQKKALDGCEILFALRFGEFGFEQLPLAGGRVVEREAPRPVALGKNPTPPPPALTPAAPSPKIEPRRSLALDRPMPAGPAPKRSQLSMFDEEAA